MQIIVTGLIATYTLGGLTLDYLQYIQSLHLLGHNVSYLEDTRKWVYNPELSTFTEDCSYNLRYLDAVLTLAIPESHFAAGSVLTRLLQQVGL